jgi:putative ABC transport system permease protein
MFTGLSGFALLLASLGLYGLISYGVAQRSHEVGVRMALGARPRDVVALILRQGLVIVTGGLVVGLVAAVAMARLLASLIYGVDTGDPLVFLGCALLLGVVAAVATFLPARRATLVDPVVALR